MQPEDIEHFANTLADGFSQTEQPPKQVTGVARGRHQRQRVGLCRYRLGFAGGRV